MKNSDIVNNSDNSWAVAGATLGNAMLSFWGADLLQANAERSGYASGQGCTGEALLYGALTGGQIVLSAGVFFGGNNAIHPFYRLVGPGSRPGFGTGTWLTRGTIGRTPYGSIPNAVSKLQIPPVSQVNGVVRAKNVWFKYIAGPRPVQGNPQWGVGGGWEYRVGGF